MKKGFLSPLEECSEVGVLETALPEHLGKVLRSLETRLNIGMPFEGLEELFIASPEARRPSTLRVKRESVLVKLRSRLHRHVRTVPAIHTHMHTTIEAVACMSLHSLHFLPWEATSNLKERLWRAPLAKCFALFLSSLEEWSEWSEWSVNPVWPCASAKDLAAESSFFEGAQPSE